ncbi:MAG: DUF6132 family protein [Bacteroidales bacterium]|nr:DUF6132 family protein [Bacteroidales bacterium]MDD2322393.1 DUF6132 family protein [Bacteroidales bacterium]MDD3009696.1 DUF6132 family protein [Bacteroidales bacterium]MDD3960797.1 DUF6132 family protein [Bacteroidales bacterium]MDY0285236.1 DUF6132 family protein [Bacteroidales bacterium]
MKKRFKPYLIRIIFLVAGALGGFLYWRFIGCSTGSCPIQSIWYFSTIFGAILGYLLGGMVEDFLKKIKTS